MRGARCCCCALEHACGARCLLLLQSNLNQMLGQPVAATASKARRRVSQRLFLASRATAQKRPQESYRRSLIVRGSLLLANLWLACGFSPENGYFYALHRLECPATGLGRDRLPRARDRREGAARRGVRVLVRVVFEREREIGLAQLRPRRPARPAPRRGWPRPSASAAAAGAGAPPRAGGPRGTAGATRPACGPARAPPPAARPRPRSPP